MIIEFQVFSDFGIFTLMFLHILKTFANIFLVLAPFIVGFAYAFYAILNETAVLERFYNQSSIYTVMKVGVWAGQDLAIITENYKPVIFDLSIPYKKKQAERPQCARNHPVKKRVGFLN